MYSLLEVFQRDLLIPGLIIIFALEIKTNHTMNTKIIEINNHLFAEDDDRGMIDLYPLKEVEIGDEVFWIDPCYWRGDEHSSKWGIVTDIRGEIIELNNGTEVYLEELYW